ncbi:MAG: CvpA family protein [Niabella sp.]
MFIDSVCLILLVLAIFKGYRQGLIVGLFSYVALIVGLAAAMKLSTVVAGKIGTAANLSGKWLPFIAFALVFLAAVLIVRWGAKLIQLTVEKIMLGWVNRLGGILLFSLLYLSIFSIFLFYLDQLKLLTTPADSVTYAYIRPLGSYAIDSLGKIIPVFKELFAQLQHFFEGIAG